MRGPAVRPIAIAAGGTGGHVFPAEALAIALVARGQRIVLITDARSGALQSPVFAGREQFVIAGAGLAGRGAARGRRGRRPGARRAAGADDPAAAGCGGRGRFRRLSQRGAVPGRAHPAAAPALLLHEQNAVLGRANRALARGADLLALSFADTARLPADVATQVVGNPVRPAMSAPRLRTASGGSASAGAGRLAGRARVLRHRAARAGSTARRAARAAVRDAAMPRGGSAPRARRLCRKRDRRRAGPVLRRRGRAAGGRAPGGRARRSIDSRRAGRDRPSRHPGAAAARDRRPSIGQCAGARRSPHGSCRSRNSPRNTLPRC